MLKLWAWLFPLLLLVHLKGIAQETLLLKDSLPALSNVISFYTQTVKDDSFLNEGREYVGFDKRIVGHPFFGSGSWQTGSIIYKGQLYPDVSLMYDMAAEEVVVHQYTNSFKVKLNKKEVEYFSLSGHQFVRLQTSGSKNISFPEGFYDLLYNGQTPVLVKRDKKVVEEIKNSLVRRSFVQENQIYLKKEGKYFPVRSKRSALRVLRDQKKELRKYLKNHKVKFRKDPENATVKMAAFYDQQKP